jgi:hypothetical protein
MPPASLSALPSAAALTQVWRVDELAAGERRAAHRPRGAGRALARWRLAAGRPGGGAAGAARAACVAVAVACAGAGDGQQHGPVVLVGAPYVPFGPGAGSAGLPESGCCACVPTSPLRACGRPSRPALRRRGGGAGLAAAGRAPDLRRLHLAAQQRQRLLFVFRTLAAQHDVVARAVAPAAVRARCAAGAHPQAPRPAPGRAGACPPTPRGWRRCWRRAVAAKWGGPSRPEPGVAVPTFRTDHALDRPVTA